MRGGLDESCYIRDENDKTTEGIEQTRGLKSQKGIINNAFRDMSRQCSGTPRYQNNPLCEYQRIFDIHFSPFSYRTFYRFISLNSFPVLSPGESRIREDAFPSNPDPNSPQLSKMCFKISSGFFPPFVEKKRKRNEHERCTIPCPEIWYHFW